MDKHRCALLLQAAINHPDCRDLFIQHNIDQGYMLSPEYERILREERFLVMHRDCYDMPHDIERKVKELNQQAKIMLGEARQP